MPQLWGEGLAAVVSGHPFQTHFSVTVRQRAKGSSPTGINTASPKAELAV